MIKADNSIGLRGNHQLICGQRILDLSKPHVMGILNVTPDSFSDGGCYTTVAKALKQAEKMVDAGATLIDVGGESTRPNAVVVSDEQELDRVIPVVEAIARELDVIISVDTSSAQVMLEAAKQGAGLINDVRSLQRPDALAVASQTKLPVCLMHMRGEPQDMQQRLNYVDIVDEVKVFLNERVSSCEAMGITKNKIIIDPGFGFAKNLTQNLHLFHHLDDLLPLGFPLLIGVSRKSMIGQVLDKEVHQRLYGSLALVALAMTKGASIFRVHDVAETMDVVKMIMAVEAEV